MPSPFPEPIERLPEVALPFEGARAYLSQAEGHQILFMSFDQDVELAEHVHEAQWAVVLAGSIELIVDGHMARYSKGDSYFIPSDTPHSGRIFAGYADITFFNQPDRYSVKDSE